MKKIITLFLVLAALTVLVTGCNLFAPKQQAVTPPKTQITYFEPTAKTNKFCDGAKMDSEGFRKTITFKETATLDMSNLTREQLIKQTLIYAVPKADFSIANNVDENYLKIIGDTVYIQPIQGWAGISIFLCYWKPFIEVNLLQFPEIKKVVWTTDDAQYQGLK